jgi:hypothetical protein
MVTFSLKAGGRGYSRCFIAADADIEMAQMPAIMNNSITSYRVFNVAGKQVGTVNLRGKTPATALAEAGFTQGVYMLKSFDGRKKFMVSSAR